MHRIVTCVLSLACAAGPVSAFHPQDSSTKAAPRACTLLTKELITRVTPARDTRYLFMVPPSEDKVGANGSGCQYGDTYLQIDPFTPARLDALYKERSQVWAKVPGVGDAAYFHDNRGEYAELFVRAGAHVLTIQMDVPAGSTSEAIKPNVIAMANALIPKLK